MLRTHRDEQGGRHRGRDPGRRRAGVGVRHPEDGRRRPHRALRGEAAARSAARAGLRHPGRAGRATSRRWASTSSSARCWSGAGQPEAVDFGRHVIPDAVPALRVQAHVYQRLLGGRRDHPVLLPGQPGAVRARSRRSIFTTPRAPSTPTRASARVEGRELHASTTRSSPRGASSQGAEIERSVIGIRSRIGAGVQHPQQPADRRRPLRDAGEMQATCARGCRPSASAPGTHHRKRHHRQERPHRPRRAHHQRGPGAGDGRRRLLHPRGDRHRPQERRHPRRHRHLSGAVAGAKRRR